MAQDIQTNKQEYNFESQLQLGELLLGLGRSREALSELNKARELRDIGAAGEAVDTAQFRLASRRLDAALEKAVALSTQNRWRNNIGWIIATIALMGVAGFAFLQLTLNRSDVIEAELKVTAAAALVETKEFQLSLALMENTRTVQEIVNQKYQIATVAADNTRIYDIVTARDRLEEAEAVITESALTAEALISSIENLTPGAPRTAGSGQMSASLFDEDRPSLTLIEPREVELLVSSVNLRAGPSTRSPVIRYAIQGESLLVLGTNQAATWYKVMGENENDVGWIAAYLTEVDSPETLPTAIAIPTIPPEDQSDGPRDAERDLC